jgi:hypothetical protein
MVLSNQELDFNQATIIKSFKCNQKEEKLLL